MRLRSSALMLSVDIILISNYVIKYNYVDVDCPQMGVWMNII